MDTDERSNGVDQTKVSKGSEGEVFVGGNRVTTTGNMGVLKKLARGG